MAAIFLSHSSRNDALASEIERWLRANGFDDLFVDHDSIRAGDKWTEELRRAKSACRVVLCLITKEWLASDECFGEFSAGWYAGRRMIPLLALENKELETRQQERLRRVLGEDQGVDLSKAGAPGALNMDADPALANSLKAGLRAAGALAKVGLDPFAFEADTRRDSNGALIKPPFPGLESFDDTDADAAIFFGRSAEIAQCLEELREYRANGDQLAYARGARAFVIHGASGSGKSSLLKAGLLPRLRRERGWLALRCFRPGADPLLNFAEAIAKPIVQGRAPASAGAINTALLEDWRGAKQEFDHARARVANLAPDERASATSEAQLAFLKALKSQLDAQLTKIKVDADRVDATVLISMDQGEELARASGESADALADYLKAALLPGDGGPAPYAVVLTVRSDSFPEIQAAQRFEGIATRTFDLRTLPTYRFDAAIEQPASRYGVEIEPILVDALMEDAKGAETLPLLAFALQRLWRQFEVEKRIRKSHYESFGKLAGLLADAAERALRGIDPDASQRPLDSRIAVGSAQDKQAARTFVPGLAQVNDRGAAMRRIARIEDLEDGEKTLLDHFDHWRLVVKSGETVEVAHEALFNEWPRFLEWLKPERERLDALRGLESAAASWDAHGRRSYDLTHGGRRLADVRRLLHRRDYREQIKRNPATTEYLARCSRRSQWRAFAFAALAGLALLGFLTVASINSRNALRAHAETIIAQASAPPETAFAYATGALPDASYLIGDLGLGSRRMQSQIARDVGLANRFIAPLSPQGRFINAEWSRDGALVLITSPGEFSIHARDGATVASIQASPSYTRAHFSNDGSHVFAWRRDGQILAFPTGCVSCRIDQNVGSQLDARIGEVISADGNIVVIRSEQNSLFTLRVGGALRRVPIAGRVEGDQFSLTDDGQYLAALSSDQELSLWRVRTDGSVQRLRGPSYGVRDFRLAERGYWGVVRVIGADGRSSFRTLDVRTGASIDLSSEREFDRFDISRSGDRVLLSRADNTAPATLWNAQTGVQINNYAINFNVMVFSPDGSRVVGWTQNRRGGDRIATFSAATGVQTGVREIQDPISTDRRRGVVFSDDGSRFAVLSTRGGTLWKTDGMNFISELGRAGVVYEIFLNLDGTRYVAHSQVDSAALWEPRQDSAALEGSDLRRWICTVNGGAIAHYPLRQFANFGASDVCAWRGLRALGSAASATPVR